MKSPFLYLLQHCFAFITEVHILTPHRNRSVYCNQRWCWDLFLVGLLLKAKLFVISNINWSEGIRSTLGSLSNQTGIIWIPLHFWNPAVLFLSFSLPPKAFCPAERENSWKTERRVRREVEEGWELQKEEGAPSSGYLEAEICLEACNKLSSLTSMVTKLLVH